MNNMLDAFINTAAEHLRAGLPVGPGIQSVLDSLRGQLDELYERYEPAAPAGAEKIRESLLDAIDLYCDALDCLAQTLERRSDKMLQHLQSRAREASFALQSAEALVRKAMA